ncbi:hypothetical protein B0H13DRAFT_1879030 [Mycena leptocephala]|nr:hypothetical protein B0H13DRAFT_1879030 [Mycena leptocephala]
MAGLHIQSLQYKLNAKGKKRGGNERTLSTTARMLTSAEGRQLAAEKRTAQLEKKAKEDENRAQRLLADAEVIKRRAELGPGSAETEQQQPEDALVDVQNVASGSISSSSDVVMAPPPPPPNAPYRFPDSWTPPQPLIHYDNLIDHLPPFTPQFYGNPPTFQPQFYPVPQYDPSRFHC